jgi:hypothetical protein
VATSGQISFNPSRLKSGGEKTWKEPDVVARSTQVFSARAWKERFAAEFVLFLGSSLANMKAATFGGVTMLIRFATFLLLLIGLHTAAFGQADDEVAAGKALKARIKQLIKQLGVEEFADREVATKALFDIGNPARDALELAAKSTDPEISSRASGILQRLPKLTHTVVDALGAPVPLAQVMIRLLKRNGIVHVPVDEPPVTSIADERGRIGIPPAPDASYRAVAIVEHPNYGRARCEFENDKQITIQVPLIRRGTEAYGRAVTGEVVDADGKPIADALIHCDHIRTPGQGLIQLPSGGSQPLGDVLTDGEGRFAIYPFNASATKERGELIPPNSRFALRINVPGNDTHFPLAGMYANKSPVRLALRRAERHFRFRFEAPGGGAIIADASLLRDVRIQHETTQDGERSLIALDWSAAAHGAKLVTGKYIAQLFVKGSMVNYMPVTVADDSPEELTFRLPPSIVYRGRVVQGVTNEPLLGAFVVGWSSTSRNNLALLTAEDWKALRDLPSNTPGDAPGLKRLRELYGVKVLMRTDADGRFEITRRADQEFYGLMTFGEDFVPYKVTVGQLKPDDKQVVEIGELPLFPAAKVLVRPTFEGTRLSVAPVWLFEKEGQPEWFDKFRQADKGYERQFEYVHWLTMNEQQPLYVPAGVNMRLRFDSPYDDKWAPATMDKPVQLKAGASQEIGDIQFAPCLPASVRVVNKDGAPIEGVPVRRKFTDGDAWCVAHNTDKDGLAYFHVRPNSQGQFWASDLPGTQEVREASNLYAAFSAQDKPLAEPAMITVTPEQIELWRGMKK